MDRATPTKDFFISYVQDDQPWAEWIAFTLEEAGYSTIIRAWDVRPGSNIVLAVNWALQMCRRTIVICSRSSLEAADVTTEWTVAFLHDRQGAKQQLLPIQIQACTLPGLLGHHVPINLVGLSEQEARKRLLAGVQRQRQKPTTVPFPPIQEQSSSRSVFSAQFPQSPSSQLPLNDRNRAKHLKPLTTHMGEKTICGLLPMDIRETSKPTMFSHLVNLFLKRESLSLIFGGLVIGWWLSYTIRYWTQIHKTSVFA